MNEIDIKQKTEELKKYISQFETASFVVQYYYLLNTHTRTGNKVLELKSALRQITYLLSLFLTTKPTTHTKIFDPVSGNAKKISELLEAIEDGYRNNYINSIDDKNLNEDIVKNHLMVSNQTFINYFVNGDLNYVEQEIDRVVNTFAQFENYIYDKTKLKLQDYIDFYEATEAIEIFKFDKYYKKVYGNETLKKAEEFQNCNNSKEKFRLFESLFDTVQEEIYNLVIPIDLLNKLITEDKAKLLLDKFSCSRTYTDELLYYTDKAVLNTQPIIILNNNNFIIPYQKQIIHSIYNYLFEICKNYDVEQRRIFEVRDKVLEEKAFELFNDFFDGRAKIFRNYFINGNEKDLLVLHRNSAFIIECKANKYREPLRDPTKAFDRIKNDFEKTIQKGYEQGWEVKQLFMCKKDLDIKNNKGKIIDTIVTRKYENVYCIIITGDRFGQIQCDLGLLLKKVKNDSYPWSVYIDDLETFLITTKRKENFYGELITYLNCREKLHERLVCFDELELCAYLIMQKDTFIKNCNIKNSLFISSPDMNNLFDELYQTGIGFKNERNLENKINKEDLFRYGFKKVLKLSEAKSVKEFRRKKSL